MKTKQLFLIGVITTFILTAGCNRVPHTGKADMKTELDSLSYALGFFEAHTLKKKIEQNPFDSLDYKTFAKSMQDSKLAENYLNFRKDQFDTIDIDMFKKGFFNEIAYDKSYFTEMTADIYIRKIFNRFREKEDSIKQNQSRENLKKGQAFLEKNALKEDVITLESGLQYKVLSEGNGPSPDANDRVKCTYHGTLIDGTVFDSSVEKGDTATFRVNGVIKGWQQALQMMPVGAKWKLFIPSDLAYGKQGAGKNIGPNETIIFEVELIDIIDDK